MSAVGSLLALVIASSTFAFSASAQDCAEGRERVGGYCCWPGQTFSTESRHCEGAPRCPETLVEHGEECVVPLFVTVPSAPTEATATIPPFEAFGGAEPTSSTTVSGWPEVHEGQVVHHPVHRSGEDAGLVAAALVVFDVGWVMGLLVGIIETASRSCVSFSGFTSGAVSCNSGGFAVIPLAGGLVAGLTNFSNVPSFRNSAAWGLALGIPSVILQSAGLITLAIALANQVDDLSLPALVQGDVSVSFLAAAPGADAGASMVVEF